MFWMRRKIPTGSIFHKAYKDKHGKTCHSLTWFIRYYLDGRRIEKPAKTKDEDDALRFLRKEMAGLDERRQLGIHPERVRMSQLFDLLLESYRRLERKSTYDVERKVESRLRKFFGHIRAMEMSSSLIAQYAKARKAEDPPAANASINRELACVRRAMKIGSQQDPPLVLRVPRFEQLPENNVREGTLTHEQYRVVRDNLPSYARIALVIAYHTGARKGEIRQIRREKIDFAAKRIELPGRTTKSKKPRYLPIYGDMAAEIEMALATGTAKCQWLIQKEGKQVHDFEKAWKTACKAANIPDALFHDNRRTALSNMIAAGLSEIEAMEISGHATFAVFRRYHITSDKRLKVMGEKLENHLREIEAEVPASTERPN